MGIRSEYIADLEAEVEKRRLLVERLRTLTKSSDRKVARLAGVLLGEA